MTEEERKSFARSRDEIQARGAIECMMLHSTGIVGLASWEQHRKSITKMTTRMIPNSTTLIHHRASQKHTTGNTNDPPFTFRSKINTD